MVKVSFQAVAAIVVFSVFTLSLGACGSGGGGGGGSDSSSDSQSTGTVSISVGDAKPLLPSGTEKVLVTFDGILVHKEGGDWISLPLPQTPYTIDLLQFADGQTTSLALPAELESGRYTQIRLGVTSATIIISGVAYSVQIPSGSLKTDKEFEFLVTGGGAVDLTVDFDLSQSIVVTGSGTYKLKPVLHLNQTQEAATIRGKIGASSFGTSTEADIIVTWDKDGSGDCSQGDEEYTRLKVEKGSLDPTEFGIFWLVPNQSYLVQIEVDGVPIYTELVDWTKAQAGAMVLLNGDVPI